MQFESLDSRWSCISAFRDVDSPVNILVSACVVY